jgi:hypothetical protein
MSERKISTINNVNFHYANQRAKALLPNHYIKGIRDDKNRRFLFLVAKEIEIEGKVIPVDMEKIAEIKDWIVGSHFELIPFESVSLLKS